MEQDISSIKINFKVNIDKIYYVRNNIEEFLIRVTRITENGFDIRECEYLVRPLKGNALGGTSDNVWNNYWVRILAQDIPYSCSGFFTKNNTELIRKPHISEYYLYTRSCSMKKGFAQYLKYGNQSN